MFYQLKNGNLLEDCILGATLLYDVALVFGMCVGSLPIKVYANNPGTTQATAKVILGDKYNTKKENFEGHVRFNVSDLPAEMQALEAHEIEDFLCIYCNAFQYLNELC